MKAKLLEIILLRLGGLSAQPIAMRLQYQPSRQSDIFIGCKPHSRISLTFRNYIPCTLMQPWLSWQSISPTNLKVEGLILTWAKIFSHVCPHFGIHGWCGIILSRLWLRGHSTKNFYSSFKDYALSKTQLQLTSMGINILYMAYM